jgi:NAD(P)-dependent dehydrogenase (short-subunit alcohol dehydrogenase family)
MTTNSDKKLAEKVIIVTGGTQGLGKGIALHLAQSGAMGLVICGRNQQNGEKVAAALAEIGAAGLYVRADLPNEADCRQVVWACDEKFGRVDGLVNAAGVTTRGTLDDTSVELWDYIFAVNARAPFILMQEAVRVMKREGRGGSIVNILSMSSYGGQPFITAYCASKGALATLTKNAANALRFDRIRVNGLNIGWTATDAEHEVQLAMGNPENWLDLAEPKQPFKRLIRPLDVAKITAYLLSDDSEMMTGAIVDFDQNVMGGFDDTP